MKQYIVFFFFLFGLFFYFSDTTYAQTCQAYGKNGSCAWTGCTAPATNHVEGTGCWYGQKCCIVPAGAAEPTPTPTQAPSGWTSCSDGSQVSGSCYWNFESCPGNTDGLRQGNCLAGRKCCVPRIAEPTPKVDHCGDYENTTCVSGSSCEKIGYESSPGTCTGGAKCCKRVEKEVLPTPTCQTEISVVGIDYATCTKHWVEKNIGGNCTIGKTVDEWRETIIDGSCTPTKKAPTTAPGQPTTAPRQPTTTQRQPTTAPSGGGGSQPAPVTQSCPADGDNCWYNEGNKCYSGKGPKGGVNKDGCVYSCGPVDSSYCKVPNEEKKQNKNREYINCEPGEAVGEDEKSCPKGKKGTCGGHYYCVWSEEGTYKSDFKCETEKETCSDKEDSSGGSTGGSCKDNPTPPPDGYTWKNSCKSCSNNDDCPRNTKDGAVNSETSNWCFSGKCLMLVTKDGGDDDDDDDEDEDDDKDDDKDDDDDEDEDDGFTKDDTGNRTKQNNEKTARDKAQKEIDKQNKDRKNQGLPTLTPLPQDWTADKAEPTATPIPTPLPPLAEPANWQGFCGQTTDSARPWGIRVSWDPIVGATRYAVRIDEDAPSWEGDTPSVGDTVDNQVKETGYSRVAKPGAVYQWWVHSVNASGVYSGLTKKLIIKCPEGSGATGTSSAETVGAGQLIVLPQSTTAVPTVAPTTTPTPTPKK